MKCIKNGSTIKRVKEDVAAKQVKAGWSYCSKAEWKEATRTAAQKKEQEFIDKAVAMLDDATGKTMTEPKVHGLKAKDRKKLNKKKK